MYKTKIALLTIALVILFSTSCKNSGSIKLSKKDLELQKKELAPKQKELELQEKQFVIDRTPNLQKTGSTISQANQRPLQNAESSNEKKPVQQKTYSTQDECEENDKINEGSLGIKQFGNKYEISLSGYGSFETYIGIEEGKRILFKYNGTSSYISHATKKENTHNDASCVKLDDLYVYFN